MSLFGRWLRAGAPALLTGVAVSAAFLLFSPAELPSKLIAAGVTISVAFLGSLIAARATQTKPNIESIYEQLENRARRREASIAATDWGRPLLAAGHLSDGRIVVCLIQRASGPETFYTLVFVTRRGKRPTPIVVSDSEQLRTALEGRGLRLVPQSEFTDAATPRLFGSDWRSP